MTMTTTKRATTTYTTKHSYCYIKMVYCYFLATTASTVSIRRMIDRSSATRSLVVGAFSAPRITIKQRGVREHRRMQYFSSTATAATSRSRTLSSSFSTALSSSSSATPIKEQQQKIPRPQKLEQKSPTSTTATAAVVDNPPPLLNLHTITLEELQELVVSWGYPKFRGKQIYSWIRDKGFTNPNDMNNLPIALRNTLVQFTSRKNEDGNSESSQDQDAGGGALSLAFEAISKDGTRKRAYELRDGQLIESVLMGPYEDGRYTACISSQAGCAMGCVFCATGQMGFARQLSSDEIFEQVSRFSSELKRENDASKRLSNVVFMGMGEPLANYRNVVDAVNRINSELGIGARKITVSTVGVVPNIKKLFAENTKMPQVRLAVSLHCADDEERTKLLPANSRYGGLHELMTTLRDYIDTTGRRVTLEWALIANQNDGIDTARQLGNLIIKYKLRRDMVHVNVIPLNPTDGFAGAKPSNVKRVNAFCNCLKNDFSITATPRVRRGIDIDAGCGQLKAKIQKKEEKKKILRLEQEQEQQPELGLKPEEQQATLSDFIPEQQQSMVGVYDDGNDDDDEAVEQQQVQQQHLVEFTLADNAVDFEFDDFENPEYEQDSDDMADALRVVSLVEQGSFSTKPPPLQVKQQSQSQQPILVVDDEPEEEERAVKGPTTTIVDEDAVRKAKKKRKKLLRNLKQIKKLKDLLSSGDVTALNREQLDKIANEEAWRIEVEDLEHNLKS